MRKHFSTLFKIAITLIGMAIVLNNVHPNEIGQSLRQAQPSWLVAAFVLMNLSLVLRAYRWLLLVRGLNVTVGFGRLIELYFVGNFFNAFLPTNFGGDVMRVVEVTQDVPAGVAAGTVIVDRLSGLLMLFVMALVGLPFRPEQFPNNLLQNIILISLIGITGGLILLEGSLIQRFGRWLPAKLSPVGQGPVATVLQAVQACGKRAVLGAMAVSIAFNLILVTWWWMTGRSLALDVPFSYYLLIVPMLSVVQLLPSIGGLGPREALAPLLLAGAGVPDEIAVTLALLVFILQRLSSLFGGPVYAWSILRKRQQA